MELTNIGVIKDLFERHGFSFTKSLGQNFLVNPAVCPKIAELGGAKAGVCALEIGTGVGVLTKELAERCEKVIAVEIDTSLKPILEETLADYDNVEIVFADVMETDLAALLAEKAPGMEVVVCANLPYYITSPVIMRVLESRLPVSAMTVMVQKEAADRICAKPAPATAARYPVRYRTTANQSCCSRSAGGASCPLRMWTARLSGWTLNLIMADLQNGNG